MQSTKTTIIITTAILLLTILTAGCTDTGGANPETVKYTPPPEEVAVVEETAASEPTETHWWDGRSNYVYGIHNTDLHGTVEGAKNIESISDGFYTISDDSKNIILSHQEWNPSQLRLDLELSSDQYRTLIDQYGSMISVTMETIDLDQDGAMDKVAVKYVGTESVLEFEMDYREGATIKNYLKMYIVYLS